MTRNGSPIQHLARPDLWAQDHLLRVDGRPFDLTGREYIIPVIRDTSPEIIVKKGAQTAFTITFLIRTFHWITEKRWHHLYLLPAKTGAVPFVQKRVDPILDSNPILKTKFKSVDNRTHKQTTDDIALLIRGTNVEAELQETNTDVIVYDEFDRMSTEFLADARHRLSGSKIKRRTWLSTPSVPGAGLDGEGYWDSTDQMKWFVPCPGCGRNQTLTFEENVKLGDDQWTCALECQFCSHRITDDERIEMNEWGFWDATRPGARRRGYHINQFNSPTMPLQDIMEGYFNGQSDAKEMKAFFNQSLGEPYAGLGDKVTPELLDQCTSQFLSLGGIPPGPVYIGIDVGHDEIYVLAYYIARSGQRVLWNMWHIKDKPGEDAWVQLENKVLSPLTSWIAVCDAHPDKRGAQALSIKYPGRFFMGYEKDRPEQEETAKFDKVVFRQPCKVIIDRTLAFDSTINQMMTGNFILPKNARQLGEHMPRRDYNTFYQHMCAMTRQIVEDARGREVAMWVKTNTPDHWHHADMFAFIATFRKPSLIIPPKINKAFSGAGNPLAA